MNIFTRRDTRGRATVLALAVLVAAALLAFAAPRALAQAFDAYTLPGNTVFPEGIAFQPSTGDFFVSSTSDGSILRGNIVQPEARAFIVGGTEGLTGTRGMKVDSAGRLFVAAGPQGMIFVFNAADGALINKFSTGVTPSFVNDVAIAPDGSAYFTDSQSPNLYRVAANPQGTLAFEPWLNVSPAIAYTEGFNLGGIAVTGDGRYLIVAQGNVGKLFRIDIASKAITEINLGGTAVTNADGIWLDGQTLYVIRNRENLLVTIDMNADFASGTVRASVTHPSFAFPTTLAKAGDRLLVVNSQFDKREGAPTLPFTVSSVPISQVTTPATATATPTLSTPSTASPTVTGTTTPLPTLTASPTLAPTFTPLATLAPAATAAPTPAAMPSTGGGAPSGLLGALVAAGVLAVVAGLILRGRTSLRR